MRNLTKTASAVRELLSSNREWIVIEAEREFSLVSEEIRFESENDELSISFLDDSGFVKHRIDSLIVADGRFTVRFGNRGTYEAAEFVPRVLARELRGEVETARIDLVNELAKKLSKQFRSFKALRVELNEHHGRFAEITARIGSNVVAIVSDVSGTATHESMLSKALVWFKYLSRRKNYAPRNVWIIADPKHADALRALTACFKETEQPAFSIWKSSDVGKDEARPTYFQECEPRKFTSLWSGSLPRLRLLKEEFPTKFTDALLKKYPCETDRLFSVKGETIRYFGLPFARTRVIGGDQKVWFGIEGNRIPLDESTAPDFNQMFDNLRRYRRHDPKNKLHEYYRAAPEAWLESILRRNIKALDANLILSPIYNQFRAAREKIDLLALRRDGRLVIIELKIMPDRDMVFQAVDYWRKVESQRRRGKLNEARLFGDREISDRPSAIYLVGPTLGFHAELDYLAGFVKSDIEIYRFDLAENWREKISVINRTRVGC